MQKFFVFFITLLGSLFNEDSEKLPVGMNVNGTGPYTWGMPFTDLMKSSGTWYTFVPGEPKFDTEKLKYMALDSEGYPLEIPSPLEPETEGPPQCVRFLVNNMYKKGRYKFLYEGEGEFRFDKELNKVEKDGDIILTFTGNGTTPAIEIRKSKKGNHIRNIRIISVDDVEAKSLFDPLFLEGLKPFHCLRFMDWMAINHSPQTHWDTRAKVNYYTQSTNKGVAIEYAIELCNLLKCDAWFCVPHMATDDYIKNFAILVRDTLDPSLKVYLEYSNELWNFLFSQSSYVLKNAPGAIDSQVSKDLEEIKEGYPEKDAYMMKRVFEIWTEEFGDLHKHRLIRVAAIHTALSDSTRRILNFLYSKRNNENERPCDAVAGTGYFYVKESDYKEWDSIAQKNPLSVTPEMVIDAAGEGLPILKRDTINTIRFTHGLDYIVYEGGQHLVPVFPKSPSNEAIWKAQTNSGMHDLYKELFHIETIPEINCKLFCAYKYVGAQESVFGSWGHLGNLSQLRNNFNKIVELAPKYAALLEANLQKE